MKQLTPADPGFRQRVHDSFSRQGVMHTLGATLDVADPGRVVIVMPHKPELTQQHGFVHAGVVATALDSACGYAAFSLMPADCSLVTVEYKMNILTPGRGTLVAKGQVVKPGRTLTVARAEVYSRDGLHVASMQQTLMMLPGTPDTAE